MKSLQEQLQAIKPLLHEPKYPIPQPKPVRTEPAHKGRHSLRPYVACVEFPIKMGGGIAWFKSINTVRAYEARGFSVVWVI
jgi:hypothetical protein